MKQEEIYDFEAEIAYFYDVPDPHPVMQAYIRALKKLEELGPYSDRHTLYQEIMPHLKEAYQLVAIQRKWVFDIDCAAELEFRIFLADYDGSSFESAVQFLADLYQHIFQSNSPNIVKAAMVRTFLYRYKAEIGKRGGVASPSDCDFMRQMAQESKELLKSL